MRPAIDHDRIETAVAAAEEGSRGEIVCVVAGEVSSYREVPLAWGAAAALVLPPIALAFGIRPWAVSLTGADWTIGHAAAIESQLTLALGAYALAQVILFGLVTAIASIPAVRRRLTPKFLKRRRVRKLAQQQFASIAAHATDSDTGVLIFVAIDDHLVEILADAAIHAKVGDPLWRQAAVAVQGAMKGDDPTAGLEAAIALCGEAMRRHFPSEGENRNVIPNRPVEI